MLVVKENEITKAIETVDEMLRQRKDRMLISDCLAISAVLKRLEFLETENYRLRDFETEHENASAILPEDVGFVEYIEVLESQNARLKIALVDAIRAPMGVCPDSAQGLLTQDELEAAEARRTEAAQSRNREVLC